MDQISHVGVDQTGDLRPGSGRVASLESRLTLVEDEIAVRNVLTKYGLACDSNDIAALILLLDEGVEMEVDGAWKMRGHQEARQLIEGPLHQSFESRCAHLMGPYVVELHGAAASATGYSMVVLASAAGYGIERLSFNRWGLTKRTGTWKIRSRRISVLVGRDDVAHAILRTGLTPQA